MVAALKDYDEDDDTTPHCVVVQIFPDLEEKDDHPAPHNVVVQIFPDLKEDDEDDECSTRIDVDTPLAMQHVNSEGTRCSDGHSPSPAGTDYDDSDDEVVFPSLSDRSGQVGWSSPTKGICCDTCDCERERPSVPKRDFQVELERTGGEAEELGLDVIKHERFLHVSRVKPGLLQRWGDAHADRSVKSGDRIIAVNGLEGSSKELVSWVKGSTKLTLTIRRYMEYVVELEKPGKLGIDIGFTTDTLKILTMTSGQMEEWNKKSGPESEVRCGDHIVQANGVRGSSAEILKVLKSDCWPVTMVLMRGTGPPPDGEVSGKKEPSPPCRLHTPSCCQQTPSVVTSPSFERRAAAARAFQSHQQALSRPSPKHRELRGYRNVWNNSGHWEDVKKRAPKEDSEDEMSHRREHLALQVW